MDGWMSEWCMLVCMCCALEWSLNLQHSPSPIPFNIHTHIQLQLQQQQQQLNFSLPIQASSEYTIRHRLIHSLGHQQTPFNSSLIELLIAPSIRFFFFFFSITFTSQSWLSLRSSREGVQALLSRERRDRSWADRHTMDWQDGWYILNGSIHSLHQLKYHDDTLCFFPWLALNPTSYDQHCTDEGSQNDSSQTPITYGLPSLVRYYADKCMWWIFSSCDNKLFVVLV